MKTQSKTLSEAEPEDDLEEELRPEYDATVLKNGVGANIWPSIVLAQTLFCWAPTLRKPFDCGGGE